MAALVGGKAVGDGLIGGVLQIEIERGVDAQAGLVHFFRAKALLEFAADFFLEPGSDGHLRLGDVQTERRGCEPRSACGVGDGAVRLHLAEHEVAAAQGLLGIEEGRVGHRALGQAGEQRGLGEGEILGVLAEVELRGGLEAVHAAAEVDLVAVEGEDLLLGEGALDLDGEVGFLELAGRGAVGGEEQIARQLHGERGGALGAAVAAEVVPERAGDAEDVDAASGDSKFLSSMEMTAWRRTGAKSS